jgi:hypothetical protein
VNPQVRPGARRAGDHGRPDHLISVEQCGQFLHAPLRGVAGFDRHGHRGDDITGQLAQPARSDAVEHRFLEGVVERPLLAERVGHTLGVLLPTYAQRAEVGREMVGYRLGYPVIKIPEQSLEVIDV